MLSGTKLKSVCCTCAEWPVVLPAILGHDPNAIGCCLPHLRTGIAQGLEHGSQEVLCVFEGGGTAVLHHVVKDAQTPLSVCPRSAGTLEE